jgi:hypothetical protein
VQTEPLQGLGPPPEVVVIHQVVVGDIFKLSTLISVLDLSKKDARSSKREKGLERILVWAGRDPHG